MTIDTLKSRLSAVRSAIASVHANGVSVNLQGSFSSASASLESLLQEERDIQRRIYRYSGYTTSTTPSIE